MKGKEATHPGALPLSYLPLVHCTKLLARGYHEPDAMQTRDEMHLIKGPLVLPAHFLLLLRREVVLDVEGLADLLRSGTQNACQGQMICSLQLRGLQLRLRRAPWAPNSDTRIWAEIAKGTKNIKMRTLATEPITLNQAAGSSTNLI
jgi:hypothetical protein